MVALDTLRTRALALPGSEEALHFKLVVFGVGRRNFATFDPRKGVCSLRLPSPAPARETARDQGLLTPAPGKYGAEGWVSVDLDRIEPSLFARLLGSAHGEVTEAPAKPARKPASSLRSTTHAPPRKGHAPMAKEPAPKGPAAYFPSIEKTYGKPIQHWLDLVSGMSDKKHMEQVAILKAEHGLGHGHANAVVAHVRNLAGN